MIDLEAAKSHIKLLRGSEDAPMHFQTFADKPEGSGVTRAFYGPLAQYQDRLIALNNKGAGIFICVCEMREGKTRANDNATESHAVFIDVDGNRGSGDVSEPSFIVRRDETHFHAYWMLEEPIGPAMFTSVQKGLARTYDSDFSVSDPARVLRLAGFYHHKGDPVLIRLET